MKIAHLSDIHIRFGSRHEEYRDVFKSLYKDLKTQKPERIAITGDLSHLKVNISPGSIDLLSEFLVNLSKIAPVDIILGNHDINLQQKEQGDSISPIFKIVDRFTDTNAKKQAFIIEDNKSEIDYSQKGIYLFLKSDLYKISDTLIYGVFSCKDNKIINIGKKKDGIKYVALFHGQIKGARGDNGYELIGENLLGESAFSGFDVVMLGDIHEHQSFRDNESMAYAGSLIQQDYGESIDKGYLMWDLENNSFQRRYVLNDYGFAKITIAKGELLEDRIENIKFSNNKKKTKVHVLWEDYEENYSIEKEAQISKFVKEKHGCDVVKVEFAELKKQEQDNSDLADSRNEDTYLDLIKNYLLELNPDEDDEIIENVLELAKKIDKELEISPKINDTKLWDVDKIEISNIFSFPESSIIIPMKELRGTTGIFGKNYSGKSNVVKALVWGLYQHILDSEQGSAKKLVNIYTSSNKGFVKIYITLDGEEYFIKRIIETNIKKNGEINNTYPVEYKKKIFDENGKEKWVDEISDKKSNERTEVKSLILEAIGDVDDFTKVCLQTQGGKESYINQSQQPKNDLVNKYLGLELYRDRYDYGKKTYNDVKKEQKELGDVYDIQKSILDSEDKISILKKEYKDLKKAKESDEEKKDEIDKNILENSKALKRFIDYNQDEFNSESLVSERVDKFKKEVDIHKKEIETLSVWLSENFKKELPFGETETIESLSNQLENENRLFVKEKAEYIKTEDWLKQNLFRDILDTSGMETQVGIINQEIIELKNKLPTYKGEKCPTCGHVTAEPNVEAYNECVDKISEKTKVYNSILNNIQSQRDNQTHNSNVKIQEANLNSLKNSLLARKAKKDKLKERLDLVSKSKDIVLHNELVEKNSKSLDEHKNNLNYKNNILNKAEDNINKIKENEKIKKHNDTINEEINKLEEKSKTYKFSIYGLNQQISDKNAEIKVEEERASIIKTNLEKVKEAEKKFKTYSLYLQAVHRDGIPAKIIRRKLPIINNKINSILSSIVNFKIEMSINTKGDVSEGFYFSPDKTDILPLSFASGAQKFISSVVIKDALHYMSNLIKPSLNIIDEGFGTLDDELVSGIITVLQYLKNKYKNVLIITHRNEIKDSVNNIIEVYKDSSGISEELLEINKHAGITKINIS